MNNLKDTITTVCGILFAVCGAIIGIQTQVALPEWIITVAVVVGAISAAVTMYLTGKNPDGTKKTPEQAAAINDLTK
jgi:uncharacterized membrane protein YfcA